MAATYEPIATTTLGSATASITFSSISSAYTDLRLVLVCTTTAAGGPRFRFNGDTGTNSSLTYISGNGTAASSGNVTTSVYAQLNPATNSSATIPIYSSIDIFNYTGSTYKTSLITSSYDFNGSGAVLRSVALWRSTAAINSLELNLSGTTFAAGTTATLYGILKA